MLAFGVQQNSIFRGRKYPTFLEADDEEVRSSCIA